SDAQLRQLRQISNQTLGDSVCKILRSHVSVDICERQHRDRIYRGPVFLIMDLSHRAYETITAPGNRFDELTFTRPLTECASQRRDIARQISLFDGRVRPNNPHHLVFAEDVPAVFY